MSSRPFKQVNHPATDIPEPIRPSPRMYERFPENSECEVNELFPLDFAILRGEIQHHSFFMKGRRIQREQIPERKRRFPVYLPCRVFIFVLSWNDEVEQRLKTSGASVGRLDKIFITVSHVVNSENIGMAQSGNGECLLLKPPQTAVYNSLLRATTITILCWRFLGSFCAGSHGAKL